MKRWLINLILAVVVLLVVTSGLFAQEISDLEMNLYVAGNSHTKSDFQIGYPQAINPIPGEFRLNDSLSGGMRVNVNTTRHWGEEFIYSFEPNKTHFSRASSQLNLPIRIQNLAVNALYYISPNPDRKVRPFVTLGGGVSIFMPTAAAITYATSPLGGNLPSFTTSPEFAFNAGIGYKLRISQAIGFRMDVRGIVTRNPSFGLPRSSSDPSATVFPDTGSMESFEVSAGFYFRLKK